MRFFLRVWGFAGVMVLMSTLMFSCGGSSGGSDEPTLCDNSSITTYTYLMAFQGCMEECNIPVNHTVYLAGSDDGADWTLISAFEPLAGSVPGLAFYNDFLYVFHTQGEYGWQKYNACFELVESDNAILAGSDENGWVDPSPIILDDIFYLFYLPRQERSDPASCNDEYPCTREIHSATADTSALTALTQQDGNRAAVTIENAESVIQMFADPDIIELNDGTFLLYVSIGSETLVYEGTTIDQSYTIPGGGSTPLRVSTRGGVPGAIQAPDGSIWLYVTANGADGSVVIDRGISADGITPIDDDDFVTVIDHTISDDISVGGVIASPFITAWPGDSWSRTIVE
jgi:hypothetical protein